MPDVSSGWGRLTWGQASWNEATVLTQGWGAKSWGDSEWGQLSDETITLTGISSTTAVGTLSVEIRPGWGTLSWGINGWGSVEEANETLPGFALTSAIGTLTVTDQHFRVHYAHHFNGAIVNYIPFVKKLRIHVVAGASALWIKESNYLYEEVLLGIERTFKIQRSRFRFGIYFVAAESTNTTIAPRIKFAVNQYSIRDQSWGY